MEKQTLVFVNLQIFFLILLFIHKSSSEALIPIYTDNGGPNFCPPSINGPFLEFTGPIQLFESNSSVFGCSRLLECNVLSSPMDSAISWYRGDEMVQMKTVEGLILKTVFETKFNEVVESGVGEISHRICVDQFSSKYGVDSAEYKCRARLSCNPSKVIESNTIVLSTSKLEKIRNKKGRRPEFISNGKAPLINLITSSRLEMAGSVAQMICKATGNPKPKIEWTVLSADGLNTPQSIQYYPFIMKLDNDDLAVDTSKTRLASMTFNCLARNRFGEDSTQSTLIILDN